MSQHEGSSHQSGYYGRYGNQGQHASGGGAIYNINQFHPSNAQEELNMSQSLNNTNTQHDSERPRADHEIYSDQLLSKKRGYPLWVPGPGMQLPIEYRQQGISIGDVGIITSAGGFDFLLNIFQPATHPINRGVVPRGFSPLSLEEFVSDIQRTTVYGPGTYVASSSVRKISMNRISASETPIDQRFESTAKEAAILIMPDGATTLDLLNTRGVSSTISSNVKDWYTYARVTRGRETVKNGDIRVVVGVDKVSSWGIATSACNTGQISSYVFKHDPVHAYTWDCTGGSGRVGPQRDEIDDLILEVNTFPQNQCVFVRTMNFTVQKRIWNDLLSEEIPLHGTGSGNFARRDPSRARSRGRRGRGSRGRGTSSSRQHGPVQEALDFIPSVNFDPVELGVIHPSAALHDCLHEKFPDADMVITEDMDWISVLNDDDVFFPKPEDLCARILEAHEVQTHEGIVHLSRNLSLSQRPSQTTPSLAMLSHDVPSDRSGNNDHKFYGTYTNLGHHATGRGIINIINPSNPLEELEEYCSPTAAFDTATRFEPPRCSESTRLRIIQIIEEWVNGDEDTTVPSSLFWLHGGAGAGKSALAQSLSEKFQGKKQLAASFFFSRSDSTRNNGAHLIPTLVSHLAVTFEEIVPFVEDRILKNAALFTKNYQFQIQELLVEPLLAVKSTEVAFTHPRLVVIDGLDECENPDVQVELLRVMAYAIRRIPYPLRFLVTSRPEAHIRHAFNHDPGLQATMVHGYNISNDPDADMDIHKFLEKQFVEIRQVHPLGRNLPDAWPGQKVITSLVERSSGHFIYASTIIRYIRSPKHRPDDRLAVILQSRPPGEKDRPYAQLDALYASIFDGIDDYNQLEKICLVLGIIYFQIKGIGFFSNLVLDYTTIEGLLEMKDGDLVLLLNPILSLVDIYDKDGDQVRIFHMSLMDYLLDSTRGGHLPFDLSRVHESAATYILKRRIVKGICDMDSFRDFAYHCRYAHLNDTLKDYLRSLEVPCPKSVMTMPKIFPLWNDKLNLFLQPVMWNFFRTLSRDDFDSTGQAHGEYAANWIDYFHRDVEPRNRIEALSIWLKLKLTTESKLPELKSELDTLLKEWKPQGFNMTDGKGAFTQIEQEHSVFSAYAKASFSSDTNMFLSSLVFGDFFIHSYDVGIIEGEALLALRTYSIDGNTCYRPGFVRSPSHKIVQLTRDYLTAFGNYLLHQ